MTESKFWLGIWGIIAFTAITTLLITSFYYQNVNEQISLAIKNGADPITASCAFNDTYNKQPACMIKSIKVNK